MLPDEIVAAFTLAAGTTPPTLSLYVETDAAGKPLKHMTAAERVPVAANLRLHDIGEAFASELPSSSDPLWTDELRALWKLARNLADARGKPDIERIDYSYYVDWDAQGVDGEKGRVAIVPRPRGSPLDKLVAELMIHVNATWGKRLADAGAPGLYRVQATAR